MKTLFLLRHAKSSWDDASLPDFKRPLNSRGEKTAPVMGRLMRDRGFVPGIVISSPAERARQTAAAVLSAAGFECDLEFEPEIYGAGTSDLLDVISRIDDGHSAAMLVGHNPTFENLVRVLTGRYERMPTAALAVIGLEVDGWADVEPGRGQLTELICPKDV